MNLKEFAALKVGDKIENHMSNARGEVASVDATGVRIRWLAAGAPGDDRNAAVAPTWHYSVNSTAWFHWSHAPRDCTDGPCYREDCRRGDQCLGGDYAKIASGCTSI